MDSQLRDLLDAAVGEPPHRVTPEAVGRRVRRRRLKEGAGAALAVLVLAGLGVTVAAVRSGPGPADTGGFAPGLPRFYVQQGFGTPGLVVRATATGTVTATVRCPWPGAQVAGGHFTATAGQGFFLACQKSVQRGQTYLTTGSRIYRFQLTGSGRVSGYSLVPGGLLGKHTVEALTAAPDGSRVAVTVGPAVIGGTSPVPDQILIINTRTGARAVWRGSAKLFGAEVNSFIHDGRDLVFVGTTRCTPSKHSATCRALRTVSTAAAGGQLDSSRRLLPLSALLRTSGDYINAVVVSPDGTTLTAAVMRSPGRGPDQVLIVRFSASGRQLRVIYRMRTGNGFMYRFFGADPSGRYFLLDAGTTKATVNGWIDHGRLIPLAPSEGSGLSSESW
ncbi:MAG TPA: hypothetical protein VH480_14845 [Streptosporangiaceae bacterium]